MWTTESCRPRLSEAAHLCLGLIQPEPHIHLAVHRRSGREVFPGILTLALASVELAEAEVAVGDDRPYAQFLGKGQGLPVSGFGLFGIRRAAMRSDLAESPERPRLVRPSVEVTSEVEGLFDGPDRILFSVGQSLRLTQVR
jgi:hypothetical protein